MVVIFSVGEVDVFQDCSWGTHQFRDTFVSRSLALTQGAGGVCVASFLAVGRCFRKGVTEFVGLGGLG